MSMSRLAIAFLVASLAMTAAGAAAAAQTSTGTIVGRVIDQQGGALPGTTVTLLGKTALRTQITDASGAFRFVALDVDTYSLRAELAGFRGRQGPLIELGIGNSIELTLELELAAIAEQVAFRRDRPKTRRLSDERDRSQRDDRLSMTDGRVLRGGPW